MNTLRVTYKVVRPEECGAMEYVLYAQPIYQETLCRERHRPLYSSVALCHPTEKSYIFVFL
jgi:hypothetical protein